MGNSVRGNLGYSISPVCVEPNPDGKGNPPLWKLNQGSRSDGDVSVFSYQRTGKNGSGVGKAARNAISKGKKIVHPCVVKYLEGVETPTAYYIVTECVVPVSTVLSRISLEEVRLGLFRVLTAVQFLHAHQFVHNSINLYSVFVSSGKGEWRLGSLEWTLQPSSITNEWLERTRAFRHPWCIPPEEKVPPTARKATDDLVLFARDAWALHHVIPALIESTGASQSGEVARLLEVAERMGSPHPEDRPPVSALLELPFFQEDPLLSIVETLKQLRTKTGPVKAALFRGLASVVAGLPMEIVTRFILPDVLSNEVISDPASAPFLPYMFTPCDGAPNRSRRTGMVNLAVHLSHVLPVVLRGLQGRHRHVRLPLLAHLGCYGVALDRQTLQGTLFDEVVLGLADIDPVMVRASADALCTLAELIAMQQRLPDGQTPPGPFPLGAKFVGALLRASRDGDPGVRAYVVSRAVRLASALAPHGAERIPLTAAVKQALTDPDAGVRASAVQAMWPCCVHDGVSVAVEGLGLVTRALLDPDAGVRATAGQAIQAAVDHMRAVEPVHPSQILPVVQPASSFFSFAHPVARKSVLIGPVFAAGLEQPMPALAAAPATNFLPAQPTRPPVPAPVPSPGQPQAGSHAMQPHAPHHSSAVTSEEIDGVRRGATNELIEHSPTSPEATVTTGTGVDAPRSKVDREAERVARKEERQRALEEKRREREQQKLAKGLASKKMGVVTDEPAPVAEQDPEPVAPHAKTEGTPEKDDRDEEREKRRTEREKRRAERAGRAEKADRGAHRPHGLRVPDDDWEDMEDHTQVSPAPPPAASRSAALAAPENADAWEPGLIGAPEGAEGDDGWGGAESTSANLQTSVVSNPKQGPESAAAGRSVSQPPVKGLSLPKSGAPTKAAPAPSVPAAPAPVAATPAATPAAQPSEIDFFADMTPSFVSAPMVKAGTGVKVAAPVKPVVAVPAPAPAPPSGPSAFAALRASLREAGDSEMLTPTTLDAEGGGWDDGEDAGGWDVAEQPHADVAAAPSTSLRLAAAGLEDAVQASGWGNDSTELPAHGVEGGGVVPVGSDSGWRTIDVSGDNGDGVADTWNSAGLSREVWALASDLPVPSQPAPTHEPSDHVFSNGCGDPADGHSHALATGDAGEWQEESGWAEGDAADSAAYGEGYAAYAADGAAYASDGAAYGEGGAAYGEGGAALDETDGLVYDDDDHGAAHDGYGDAAPHDAETGAAGDTVPAEGWVDGDHWEEEPGWQGDGNAADGEGWQGEGDHHGWQGEEQGWPEGEEQAAWTEEGGWTEGDGLEGVSYEPEHSDNAPLLAERMDDKPMPPAQETGLDLRTQTEQAFPVSEDVGPRGEPEDPPVCQGEEANSFDFPMAARATSAPPALPVAAPAPTAPAGIKKIGSKAKRSGLGGVRVAELPSSPAITAPPAAPPLAPSPVMPKAAATAVPAKTAGAPTSRTSRKAGGPADFAVPQGRLSLHMADPDAVSHSSRNAARPERTARVLRMATEAFVSGNAPAVEKAGLPGLNASGKMLRKGGWG